MRRNKNTRANIPTILIILGATGDLTAKKIVPALFDLFKGGELPQMVKVIGFARRDLSDNNFRARVKEILKKYLGQKPPRLEEFQKLFSYARGHFENAKDYHVLAKTLKMVDDGWGVCSNKLFYLAVPPDHYAVIFKHLAASGLTEPCGGPNEGWTRVIVEKPFGSDEKSAKALDKMLSKFFKETQIYRVDHYLAKEMLQNILTFRFANNLFEYGWGRELIEKISARALEKIGAEGRGAFYDKVGALRDVGQNHLLQMIALMTMEQPVNLSADAVREKRAEILDKLSPLSREEIARQTFRAQYEGYREIENASPRSERETYFKVKFFLDSPRWQGVPMTIESGKRLGEPQKEIEITFAHPEPCPCPPGPHYKNSLIFHLEPKEGITIRFWSKKPGFRMELEERTLDFNYRPIEKISQYIEEYKKLLLDCIVGDQTLFVSSDEVVSMWRFIDPITRAWEKNAMPLRFYKPDTKDIVREAEFVDGTEPPATKLKKEIGIVGLGKMGANVARQLKEKGWRVVVSNRSPDPIREMEAEGFEGAYSLRELAEKLTAPRIIWLMITAGKGVNEILFGSEGFAQYLKKGDIVIDAGNSFYEDTVRRAKKLQARGIKFMDVGFSGGPAGARHGGSLMVGGEKKTFEKLEQLFYDLSVRDGYGHMGKSGAGHFVKMVHNGIEYGMMQSLAEGFAIMKKSSFKIDLRKAAEIYNRGSVIESRLVGWMKAALETFGEDMKNVSGTVHATGEGEWTVKTAKKLKVPVPIIEESFKFRMRSQKHPSYIGKILSALRNQFGGHAVSNQKKRTKP